jgi:hypothetical protein
MDLDIPGNKRKKDFSLIEMLLMERSSTSEISQTIVHIAFACNVLYLTIKEW